MPRFRVRVYRVVDMATIEVSAVTETQAREEALAQGCRRALRWNTPNVNYVMQVELAPSRTRREKGREDDNEGDDG